MSVNVPSSEWRLRTTGGIPVKWVSHSGNVTEDTITATDIYLVEASRLQDLIEESFPEPLVILSTITHEPPPSMPGYSALKTNNLSWKPHGDGRPIDPFDVDGDAPVDTYNSILEVTIGYVSGSTNDEDPEDPLTFLEISADASGEFITSPTRGKAKWPGGIAVQEIDVPHVLVESLVEWTARWTQIPYDFFNTILLARMRAALGMVNSAPMTVCFGSPTESVLFLGYNMRQQFTWWIGDEGPPPVELEFKFLEKNFTDGNGNRVHHNLVYRPGEGYQRMTIGGAPLYTLTDLNSMFLP